MKQRSVIERELGGAGAVGADEGSIQDILEFRCPPLPAPVWKLCMTLKAGFRV